MKPNHKTANKNFRHAHRLGFTLIELMVVIVIIGILMALILPAINAARIKGQVTAVAAEITQLDQAIATFKNQFQVEPPSSLNIPAAGANWNTADAGKIRTIWPSFNFASRGGLDPALPAYNLNGAECLVFFLGGIEGGSPGAGSVAGFSKNPVLPWSAAGTNRVGPFFEFDAGRFVDVDGDTLFEYRDDLPDQETPYLYLSSQGKLYNKTNNGSLLDDFDVFGSTNDMTSIYLKADDTTPQRASSYQLISPGLDKRYGIGGRYTDGSELTNIRNAEADNITNFSSGALKP